MLRLASLPLLLAFLAGCAAEPADGRPNVVLVVVDTLRADHLGSYGFPHGATPRLDRIAAQSALFERAVAAAPSTIPSHAAMLTSRYAREIGAGFATGEGSLTEVETLASAFRAAGYATGAFVGNVVLRSEWGFDRGFDVYDEDLERRDYGARAVMERTAEATTERALAWIEGVRDRPFLLWVHYQDPHGPYGAPAPFAGRFRLPPEPAEEPLRVLKGNGGLRGIPAYQALDGVRLPSAYRSRYADEVHYADHFIGTLVDAVEAHPSGRELVFLLTSDHGEALGEAERFFVHEYTTTPELSHVPFLLRAPGIPPGPHAQTVGHVDVMPTLLELAGVAPPSGLRGVALGPHLRDGTALPSRFVFCDRGTELSAYGPGGFVRVTGIHRGEHRVPADASEARFAWWSWAEDGSFAEGQAIEPAPEIRAFVRGAAPIAEAPMDAGTRDQLRALGYLEEAD